jgi:transposase/uncharacterized coiled-coil protein SlyX
MTVEERLQLLEQKLNAQTALIQQKDALISNQQAHITCLTEQLKLARLRQFGRSSERYVDTNQLGLFSEEILPETEDESDQDGTDTLSSSTEVASHTRQKNRGKRTPLPSCLERVRIEHRLEASDLITESGDQYVKIGEEISEQLDIVPATVRVLQNVRFKYAVKGKEELGVKIAPITGQPIPKSVASSGLLAHMVQAKYCHHLPLYRQEQIWNQLEVSIPRNSMARWVLTLGELASPIVEELLEQIKSHKHLHVDETTLTVVNDKNKKPENPSHTAYMWVYTNNEGVVFDYQSSREGIHACRHLEDYSGYVQSDAYSGYNQLFQNTTDRIAVGCMAHARRKFTDILKSLGKKKKNSHAEQIVKVIGKLYKIEAHCSEEQLTDDQRKHYRLEHSEPILKNLKIHLDTLYPKTPPQGLLGKAIAYMLNNWQQLNRYLEDGCIPIDNNAVERKIRPFTIGRNNWMFCQNSKGAKASANLYSLIESAKLYDLKIFDYLKYVFEKLPQAKTEKQFEALTPKYCHHLLPKIKSKSAN